MEYKNFLPKKYLKRKEINRFQSKRRVLFLMVIYNLCLLPVNYNSLTTREEINIIDDFDISFNKVNKSDILKWLEIDSDSYITLNVNNEIGDITVDTNNKSILYNIEDNGFKIKEIKRTEKIYEIKVE